MINIKPERLNVGVDETDFEYFAVVTDPKPNLNLHRVMFGWERPDIGWLGRPYHTFDNVPYLERKIFEKGAGVEITGHWPMIQAINPDDGIYTSKEKTNWLQSTTAGATDMPVKYDDLGRFWVHTPEVSGGALVNVLDIDGDFAIAECWDASKALPEQIPAHFIYTWSALYGPILPDYPTGKTWYPKGGVKFISFYWRDWAYLPYRWLVKI